jgi:hypothetical protein
VCYKGEERGFHFIKKYIVQHCFKIRHFEVMKRCNSLSRISIDAAIVSLQNLPFLSDTVTIPYTINKFQLMKCECIASKSVSLKQ